MKSNGRYLIVALIVLGCAEPDSRPTVLMADLPLHLEEHLEQATIEASEVPTELPGPVEWSFDEPQPEWRPVRPWRQICQISSAGERPSSLPVHSGAVVAPVDWYICLPASN